MTNVRFKVLLLHQHEHLEGFTVVFVSALFFNGRETACGSVVKGLILCCVNCGHAVGDNGGRECRGHTSEQNSILLDTLLRALVGKPLSVVNSASAPPRRAPCKHGQSAPVSLRFCEVLERTIRIWQECLWQKIKNHKSYWCSETCE